MMKLAGVIVAMGLAVLGTVASGVETNLCFNGNFSSTNSPLEGWIIDYRWDGNSNYMNNHNEVTYVAEHEGRKNVMRLNPGGEQSKAECKLIKYEQGARYRCTVDVLGGGATGNGNSHFYFTGYSFAPGVAPYDEPDRKDMRRVFKGKYWSGDHIHPWRTISFEFPMSVISELDYKHLKRVRYFTAYFLVNRGEPCYLANVKVVKLPGTFTVKKNAPKASESKNPASKLGTGLGGSPLKKGALPAKSVKFRDGDGIVDESESN